jgi:uncharacterized Fe-S cluster-containing protein
MVFPVAHTNYRPDYEPLKNTRESYFHEIRNILNGFCSHRHYGNCDDYQAEFIKQYQIIKNGEIKYMARDKNIFNWLEDKDIKKVIKKWQGKPLDVLYYINRHRYIEKAVMRYHRMEVVSK